MSTEAKTILVAGIVVDVIRKDIKNLHLAVYPPTGRVRVAVPLVINDEAVRLAVIGKLPWIKRQRLGFAEQDRQSSREMVNGESHWYQGQRYRLKIVELPGRTSVRLRGMRTLVLAVRPDMTTERRREVLEAWYRRQLKTQILPLLEFWQNKTGVVVSAWGVKLMRTRWGSCNIKSRRIWINLELAKKPTECLEYIVVHELLHFLEPHHDDRFRELLSKHLPHWEYSRAVLNSLPLSNEIWG